MFSSTQSSTFSPNKKGELFSIFFSFAIGKSNAQTTTTTNTYIHTHTHTAHHHLGNKKSSYFSFSNAIV